MTDDPTIRDKSYSCSSPEVAQAGSRDPRWQEQEKEIAYLRGCIVRQANRITEIQAEAEARVQAIRALLGDWEKEARAKRTAAAIGPVRDALLNQADQLERCRARVAALLPSSPPPQKE